MIANRTGARLKALREQRDLTQERVAALLGFNNRQTVAQVEAGERKLTADELLVLCDELDVPLEWFSSPHVAEGAKFCWRRNANVPAAELLAFEMRASEWIGTYRELAGRSDEACDPVINSIPLTAKSSWEQAALVGEQIAGHYKLGPIPSAKLACVMESELSMVVLMIDASARISGAACVVDNLRVALVNRREPKGRRSFDLAHELFHLLTWEAMPPEHVEDAGLGQKKSRVEELADKFAAGLLMPRSVLDEMDGRVTDPDWLNEQATRLGVSSKALVIRLKSVGRLNQSQVDAIDDDLLKFNGRGKDAEEQVPPAFGPKFMKVVAESVDKGQISVRRVTKMLGVSSDELVDILAQHGIENPIDA